MTSNLFDEASRAAIARISRVGEPKLTGLIEAFEAIGQHFRKVILATPSRLKLGPKTMTPGYRAEWLSENVAAPVSILRRALDRPDVLASYPGHGNVELSAQEWADLGSLLDKLHAYADSLQTDMACRTKDRATIDAELRCDLVFQLATACEAAGVPVARNYVVGNSDKSVASKLIDLASAKISGAEFATDHHLRDFIKLSTKKGD